MVLEYGNGTVSPDWNVQETSAPGFVRVYGLTGGKIYYEDDAGPAELTPPNLYLLPSGKPYRMTHDAANPLSCLFLHLDILPDAVTRLSAIETERDPFLPGFLTALRYAVEVRDSDLVYTLADSLNLYLGRKNLFERPIPAISQVLLYISSNLNGDLSLRTLSRLAGYQEHYFIRLFRKQTGISPHQYVMNCRMKEAMRLLRQNVSIADTAEQSGFPDSKSFSRAFHKRYGEAPSQWRNHAHTVL